MSEASVCYLLDEKLGKLKIADLFCGAGGAGTGLHRAGFEVVGFDLHPQPRYPFEFHQTDALEVDLSDFDAVWASPPCQDYSSALSHFTSDYPRLIDDVKDRMPNVPWVIENVIGAPIPKQPTLDGQNGLLLCGTMFDMPRVRRHRLFLSSHPIPLPVKQCNHRQLALNPYNAKSRKRDGIEKQSLMHYGKAMGIDWMKGKEIGEAIPPAYSEYIGKQLLATKTEETP